MEKIVIVQENPDTGELFLEFPPEMMVELDWQEGDNLNFSPGKNDRSFLIKNPSSKSRKEKMPVFLVETVETRKITYLVRAREGAHANDEVVMGAAAALSNVRLEEAIFTTREMSETDVQTLTQVNGGVVYQIPYDS